MTIPTDFVAGDVVQIHGGPYTTGADRFYIRGHGNANNPIIITGANASTKPIFQKKVHFSNSSYIIFEHIKIQPQYGGIEIRPLISGITLSNISVRFCDIVGTGSFKNGQSFSAHSDYDDISSIVFYRNTSQNSGQWDAETEDDSPCFSVQHNAQNVWILENTGFQSGGDGVILAHGANFSTQYIYIGRNTFYQNRENGIDLKQANDVIVSENIIYNHRPTSSSAGEGIVIHYDPSRIWILNNLIYDCEFGVVVIGAFDTHIVGNVIRNINHTTASYDPTSAYSNGSAIHIRNSSRIHVSHNTIANYDTGIQSPSAFIFNFTDNIFYNRMEAYGFEILQSASADNVFMDRNIFHPIVSGERIGWGSNNPLTLSTFISNFTPLGINCNLLDPLFVNAGQDNYNLLENSSAISEGEKSNSFDDFFVIYSRSIAFDKNLLPRPNDLWDIGAYEYVESGDITPPNAPINLLVL